MIQPYILNGRTLVGCPTRLGTVKKKGPVTGQPVIVPVTGAWIDADDAEELVDIKEDVWCWRENRYININTIFYLNPSEDQVRGFLQNG